MSEFAKDVAKQLDRRQRRRRLVTLGGVGTLAVLAALYLRCGSGWFGSGSGGGSGGFGVASGSQLALQVKRCAIKVTAQGILLDGKPATREAAVDACKKTSGADVIVTGDAREGDWDNLKAALEAAHVDVFLRER